MLEVVEDTLIDGLKLVPFLFITYLFMEILEHRMNNNVRQKIVKAGKTGPVWGGSSTTVRFFYGGGESLFWRNNNSWNAYSGFYVNFR